MPGSFSPVAYSFFLTETDRRLFFPDFHFTWLWHFVQCRRL